MKTHLKQFELYVVVYLVTGKQITFPITVNTTFISQNGEDIDREKYVGLAKNAIEKHTMYGHVLSGGKSIKLFIKRIDEVIDDFLESSNEKFEYLSEENNIHFDFVISKKSIVINPLHVTHIEIEG